MIFFVIAALSIVLGVYMIAFVNEKNVFGFVRDKRGMTTAEALKRARITGIIFVVLGILILLV